MSAAIRITFFVYSAFAVVVASIAVPWCRLLPFLSSKQLSALPALVLICLIYARRTSDSSLLSLSCLGGSIKWSVNGPGWCACRMTECETPHEEEP